MEGIKQLKTIMQKQNQLLDLIKTIEKSKNEILLSGKLVDFGNINENLGRLVEENSKLEIERIKTTEKISREIAKEQNKTLSFKEIVENIEEKDLKEEIFTTYEIMKSMISDIRHLSKINQEMVEVALQVIDISLSGVEERKDLDYTQNGRNNRDRSLLINRLI